MLHTLRPCTNNELMATDRDSNSACHDNRRDHAALKTHVYTSLSEMTDTLKTSPCSLFYHTYEGSNSPQETSRFTIHCTLEKGTEAYYSGVRVIVIAKKVGHDNTESQKHHRLMWDTGKFVGFQPIEDTEEVGDDHAMSAGALPFYTLVFELVDSSDATWSDAELKFKAVVEDTILPLQQIPDTHRVLYEYARHTTATDSSFYCVLPLTTRYVEHRKHNKPFQYRITMCSIGSRARIAPPTHGFRILPPSEKRPIFTQPPLEILYHIFSILACDGTFTLDNWRKELVAASLVCRAWKIALNVIDTYEAFTREPQKKPYIGILASGLEDNPIEGRRIKRFSPFCFTNETKAEAELGVDALTILKTASNMRHLCVGHVEAALAGEFVDALCKMPELHEFTQLLMDLPWADDEDSEEKSYLNAAQLTECFAHWSNLRQATVERLGRPRAEDGTEFKNAKCPLENLTFQRGFLSMVQLRAITSSSQNTLHTLVLSSIRGISNKELTSWLLEFGPSLTNLTVGSSIFASSRRLTISSEEPVIDATIHKMTKLVNLEIDGPIATAMTLSRFEPTQNPAGEIKIHNPVLFEPRAFVKALRTTNWKAVGVNKGVKFSDKLFEEAEKVAKERRIKLWIVR